MAADVGARGSISCWAIAAGEIEEHQVRRRVVEERW
jgi:hypothetical protein